jgi:hypothetical protein
VPFIRVKRKSYRLLVGKPEGKRPASRSIRRGEDDIQMYDRGIGWGVMSWNHMAQDREKWRALVNIVMNLRVP